MTRTSWWYAALAAAMIGATGGAQRTPEPRGPNLKKLVTIDTGAILFADISPDGKWLAIDVADGAIWIAPADGHAKPFRLLDGYHLDRGPYWFATSDGLTFTSNRPSRTDPTKFYGMTVRIDRATGHAVGVPRAITTDVVRVMGYASPDDRWAAYSTPGDSIKIVPITGGTARGIARAPGTQGAVMWYQDGRSLVFNAGEGNWYRAAAFGGGPPVAVAHAPFFGALHLHGDTANPITHLELRDSTERVVSALDVPPGMALKLFNYTTAAIGILDHDRVDTHVVTIADGVDRTIVDTPWIDAWAADGRTYRGLTYIGDVTDAQTTAIVEYDASGRILHRVVLPADARMVGNAGTVPEAIAFRRGPAPRSLADGATPLYVANAQTGVVRQLVARAYEASPYSLSKEIALAGPGGSHVDGDRFLVLVPKAAGFELQRVGLDGRADPLRDFPSGEQLYAAGVFQDRVAWAVRAGDSIAVFAAKGITGPAHRVVTVPGNPRAELSWSRRGDALAVNNRSDEKPAVVVVHMTPDARPVGPPVSLPGPPSAWSMCWSGDDSSLLLVSSPRPWVSSASDRHRDKILAVPADGSGPARVITANQDVEDYLLVSPDGKRVSFPTDLVTGSSIWRIDFMPVKKRARLR